MKTLIKEDADSDIPIVKYSYPPQRAFFCKEDRISFLQKEYAKTRSQDLEPLYHDSGQFCCFKTKIFLEKHTLITDNTIGIICPETEVQDIDTYEDWKLAELKYAMMKEK